VRASLDSWTVQNWSSARGRVWPGQTMGIWRPVCEGVGATAAAMVGVSVFGEGCLAFLVRITPHFYL
jgi:hypothetical protein